MRYLSTRDVFLKNFKELQLDIHKEALLSYDKDEMINEAFENDITWGGSLLGRLINSIIRKAKIQYNFYRVKSIARKIEDELMGLIGDNLTDEQKTAVKTITAKFILLSMYQLVFDLNDKNEPLPDNKKVSEKDKISYLLGDKELKLNGVTVESGNKGLINSAREYIESAPDDMKIGNDGKSELLRKLKEFEDSLQEIKKYYDQREELANGVKELLDLTYIINEDYSVEDNDEEEEEETKPEEKTGLTKDKLVVGNWYKYTTKENKIWLVKLINKDYTVQYGIDKSWGTKDDIVNKTSKVFDDPNKNIHNVYVVLQTESGEKYTGQLNTTGMAVSVSQLEELPEQPKAAAAAAPKPAKKLTKDDIIVGNMYNYTKNGVKTTVKVLSKEFQINVKTNEPKEKLANANDVFVELIDKEGKKVRYAINSDFLTERKLLPNFDKFFKNYILEDKITVDTGRVGKIEKDLDDDEAEYDDEETLAKKEVEDKIKKDLEGLDVEKLEEYKDNQDSNFSTFGKQLNEDTKLDDLEEDIFKIVEVIKKLSSTFNANTAILDKIKSSENIKKFVEILQKIKGFSSNKTGDLVESWNKVWNKDHENWKISDADNKLREDVDKTKLNINIIEDGRGRDRVINIVDLFGKAYSCFATQLIPSGRPGGRISTTTRNEYVYVGGGTTEPAMSESSGPGSGPWANIKVFTKFGDEITRLLAMQKFKQVFNQGMIKTADGDKKGNVLTEFIRNMIDESNLKSYTKQRADFITKYFGLNTTIKTDNSASGNETTLSKQDTDGSEIFWRQEREFNSNTLKPGCFIVMDFKHKNTSNKIVETIIMGQVLGIREKKLAFKFQKGAYAIPNTYNAEIPYNLPREAKFGLELKEKGNVYFALIDLPLNTQSKKIANMAFFDTKKEDEIKKMTIEIFRPAGLAKSRNPSRKKDREGLGVLYIYKEDEGEKMMINKEPDKANLSKIENDKGFNSDQVYNKLSSQVSTDLPATLDVPKDYPKILKEDF
jgi:hypothetical protein